MKTIRGLLCVLAILCCGASARLEAQGIVGPGPAKLNLVNPSERIGGAFTFTSSSTASLGFDVRGISYYRVIWVPQGTVTSCTLSLDSGNSVDPILGTLVAPTIGGIMFGGQPSSMAALNFKPDCTTAGYYVTPFPARSSLYAQITPTITGSGSVTVVLFGYSEFPWPQ
jgi:hypothetical protein